MKELLFKLEEELKNGGFSSYKYLQKGLEKHEIDKLLKEFDFPFQFPEQLYELYAWHNGQEDIYKNSFNELEIFFNKCFYSLEDALKIYSIQNIYFGRKGLFPLFGVVDTLHSCIDLDTLSRDFLKIIYYNPESDLKLQYPSIESMIEANYICYKEKIFYIKNNELGIKSDIYKKAHKYYGENCEYWDFF